MMTLDSSRWVPDPYDGDDDEDDVDKEEDDDEDDVDEDDVDEEGDHYLDSRRWVPDTLPSSKVCKHVLLQHYIDQPWW